MSGARTFVRSAGLYGVGSAVQHAATFLLLPAILHKLGPADYGWVALGDAVLALAVPFATLALPGAITRFYHVWKADSGRKEFIRTLWSLQWVTAAVLALLLIVAGTTASDLLIPGFPVAKVGPWLICTILLTAAAQTPIALLRIQERVKPLIVCNCISTFSTLGIALYLLYYRQAGVLAVFQANTLGAALLCFGGAVAARLAPGLAVHGHRQLWKETTRFALPAIPGAVVETLYGNVERFVLNSFASPAVVGLYVAAFDLARGLVRLLVHTALKPAWQPFCIRVLSTEPDKGRALVFRLSPLVIVAGASAALGATLFSRELLSLFASAEYQSAAVLVPWLAFINLIVVFDLLALVGSMMSNRTGLGSIVSILQAVTSLVGNMALVPMFGVWGAVAAFALSTLVWVGGKFRISARYYPVAYPWKRILLLASLPFIAAILMTVSPNTWLAVTTPASFAGKTVLFAVGCLLLLHWGIDPVFRQSGLQLLRSRLQQFTGSPPQPKK